MDYSTELRESGPLRWEGWKNWLQKHPDHLYREVALDIIRYGARLGYAGPKQKILSDNLSSANDAPTVLSEDLQHQIRQGRVTKLDVLPEHFISSPLGLEPKPNGKWRRIHHLSHPRGRSVNCHIPIDYGSLEYTSVDEAIAALLKIGKGAILIKRDLSDAFRHIPVSSMDWCLLGFSWEGSYYYERFLPFGLQTASFLFDIFAKGITWIMIYHGWQTLHYLNKFLVILNP